MTDRVGEKEKARCMLQYVKRVLQYVKECYNMLQRDRKIKNSKNNFTCRALRAVQYNSTIRPQKTLVFLNSAYSSVSSEVTFVAMIRAFYFWGNGVRDVGDQI
jgi:hypothetical protein